MSVPYLSPNYRQDQVDLAKLDDRIRVYEDQVRGCFLEPAKALLSVPNSTFALLYILMGYFDTTPYISKGRAVRDALRSSSAQDLSRCFHARMKATRLASI